MSTKLRSHTATTDEYMTSPTLLQLGEEWVEINLTPHDRRIHSWGVLFEACFTAGDVVDLIDTSPTPVKDQLLYALVIAPGYLPRRILLQALLPKLTKMAAQRARARSSMFEDTLQDLIGDFWASCQDYPRGSSRCVALNLIRPLRAAHYAPEIPFADVPNPSEDHRSAAVEDAGETELNMLFTKAIRTGMISDADVQLLTRVYIDEVPARAVATEIGISYASVRQRCTRIKQRLATIAA